VASVTNLYAIPGICTMPIYEFPAMRCIRWASGYSLLRPVAPCSLRIDVQKLGNSLASHPDTNDIHLNERGNIARVSGLHSFPQRVREVLSMQRGENPLIPTSGVRLFEYFEAYRGSPWLNLLFKLEIVRQASIPLTNTQPTPLQCVTRVRNVELIAETPVKNRLPVRVDFEVQGLGPWQHEVSVYMPTPEQMVESAKRLAQHRHVLGNSLAQNP
jgi:hypothetical protein